MFGDGLWWGLPHDSLNNCLNKSTFIPKHESGWWYTYPSKKYEFVSWDDYSWLFLIYGKSQKNMVPNHQSVNPWLTCAPCMVYLPTFGLFLGQMLDTWSIWVWHTQCTIWSQPDWYADSDVGVILKGIGELVQESPRMFFFRYHIRKYCWLITFTFFQMFFQCIFPWKIF